MSWSAAPPLLLAVYVQHGHMRVQPPYPSSPNIGVRDRGAGFSGSVRYVARRRRGKSSHLVAHEKKRNIQGYYLCPLGLMKPLTDLLLKHEAAREVDTRSSSSVGKNQHLVANRVLTS